MDHPTCLDCGKKFPQEILVPDHKARVAAIEVLLREGLGRVAQAEEPAVPRLPHAAEEVRALSWDDLWIVHALHFATEIAIVRYGQGRSALRDAVASLDEDERALLRQALDAAA